MSRKRDQQEQEDGTQQMLHPIRLCLKRDTPAHVLDNAFRVRAEEMIDGGLLSVETDKDPFDDYLQQRDVWSKVCCLDFKSNSRELFKTLFVRVQEYGYRDVLVTTRVAPYDHDDEEERSAYFPLLESLELFDEKQLVPFVAPKLASLTLRQCSLRNAFPHWDRYNNLVVLRMNCVKNADAEELFAYFLTHRSLVHLEVTNARLGLRDDLLHGVEPTVSTVCVSASQAGFCESFYAAMAHVRCLQYKGRVLNNGLDLRLARKLRQPDDHLCKLTKVHHLAVLDFEDKWITPRLGLWAVFETLREGKPPPGLISLDLFLLATLITNEFFEDIRYVERLTIRTINWTRTAIERVSRKAKTKVLTFGGDGKDSGVGELILHAFDDNEFVQRVEFTPDTKVSEQARKTADHFNARALPPPHTDAQPQTLASEPVA